MALRESTIDGHTQIVRLLNHLQDLQCPLVISLEGMDCYRTSLLAINANNDYLLMEGVPLPQNRNMLTPGQQVFLRANFHGEAAGFASRIIEAADLAGKALLRIRIPDTIAYRQRRAHFRVPVEPDTPISVTLILERQEVRSGTLEDVSLGGLAMRLHVGIKGERPHADACRIQLNPGEVFHSDLEISNARSISDEEVRIGARFRRLPDHEQRKLERFIRRLERESLRKNMD